MKKKAFTDGGATLWHTCKDYVTRLPTSLNVCTLGPVYTKVKKSVSKQGTPFQPPVGGGNFSFPPCVLFAFCLLAAPLWAAPPLPSTVSYNFDFRDTNTYETYNYMTDFQGWSSTDQWQNNGFIPDVSVPNSTNGQATTFSIGQVAGFGGAFMFGDATNNGPTVPTSELRFSFNPQGNNQWKFRWVQNLANGSVDDGKRDRFGWTVFSTSNTPIMTLRLTTVSPGSTNYLGTDGLEYNSAVRAFYGDITSTNCNSIQENAVLFNRGEWVSFELDIDTLTDSWSAKIGSVNDLVNAYVISGALGILAGTELGAIAQIWDLADTSTDAQRTLRTQNNAPANTYSGAGENTLLVESFSVQGVPEPSSASLVLFSSLALLAARRRRRSHS